MDFQEEWDLIEGEEGFIEVDIEKVDDDKSFFNENAVHDQLYNILVTQYEGIAYNPKKSRVFDIKVRNYLKLLNEENDVDIDGVSFGLPIVANKVKVSDIDDYEFLNAAKDTWTSANSESHDWKGFLESWNDIVTHTSLNTYDEALNMLLCPLVPQPNASFLKYDTDIAIKIDRVDDTLFSKMRAISAHPSSTYKGDQIDIIGNFVDNKKERTVTFDIEGYRDVLSRLNVGDIVEAYPHDFHDGGIIRGACKIKKVKNNRIYLSNTTHDFTFDLQELSKNPVTLWPHSLDRTQHVTKKADRNIVYLYDQRHNIDDQHLFSVTTPRQSLYNIIEHEIPSLAHANIRTLVHMNPTLSNLHNDSFSHLKQCFERVIDALPKKRVETHNRIKHHHPDKGTIDHILKKISYPFKDTYLDEPNARFRYVLSLPDFGLSYWYNSIVRDLKSQLEMKQSTTRNGNFTSFPTEYPYTRVDNVVKFDVVFKSISDAVHDTKTMKAGAIAIVNSCPVIIMKWTQQGWDVADTDEYPLVDGYIIDYARNRAYKEHDIQKTYQNLLHALLHETKTSETDLSVIENAITLGRLDRDASRKIASPWHFRPSDITCIKSDTRLFESGNENIDENDLVVGERFGLNAEELEDDTTEAENDEMLERIKRAPVDEHVKVLDELASFVEDSHPLTQEEKRIIIGYINMYYNVVDIITRLKSQTFTNRAAGMKRAMEEYELIKRQHYLAIMAFIVVLRPDEFKPEYVPRILQQNSLFSDKSIAQIETDFDEILNLVRSRCGILSTLDTNHRDRVRADLSFVIHKTWESYRPAVGKGATGAAAYVVSIVDALSKIKHEELKNYGMSLPRIERKNTIQPKKRYRPMKLHDRSNIVSKSMFMTYNLDVLINNAVTHKLVAKPVTSTRTMRIRTFMIMNPLFKDDNVLIDLTEKYDWDGSFNSSVDGEYASIVELLRWGRIETDKWSAFYNKFSLLDRNIDAKRLCNCLYYFIQGVFGKLISRSFNKFKIPPIKKKFLRDNIVKVNAIYMAERERTRSITGSVIDPLMLSIEQVLEDGLKGFAYLKFEDAQDTTDIYHNIGLLLYIFMRCMRWIIQSALLHADDAFKYVFSNDYDRVDDKQNIEAVKVLLDVVMSEFSYQSEVALIDFDKISKTYETIREESKQAILRKMNNMNDETKNVFMDVKQKGLNKFLTLEELHDKGIVLEEGDDDIDDVEDHLRHETNEYIDGYDLDDADDEDVDDD